jgi:anti-sigma factor RsiW
MKNACAKWKDQLLEAALTGTAAGGLEEHVLKCAHCAEELAALRARRERLDALLPLVAQGREPPAEFRARVLAAVEAPSEAERGRPWPVWGLAGAMAVIAVTLTVGLRWHRGAVSTVPERELAAAEKLAEWRAPSDVLLQAPGRQILRTTPKLGESYLQAPMKRHEEE